MTNEEFIAKANAVHGDTYNYDLVEYVHNKEKIDILCNKHGVFRQTPNNHLNGQGCPKCGRERQIDSASMKHDSFIKKANSIHGNRYKYLNEYENQKTILKIECKIHNVTFTVMANKHLYRKQGCPICSKESIHKKLSMTTDEFIEKAISVHGDEYDYSKCEYLSNKDKVTIICKKHGQFKQLPSNHLKGKGCKKCTKNHSRPEREIVEFIKSLGLRDIKIGSRKVIPPYEVDIFVPSCKVGIELHGLYYHSFDRVESVKEKFYHYDKASLANDNGILLLQIFESEWKYKREIIKSIICSKLNSANCKIGARKCSICDVSAAEFRKFMNDNHIQGYVNSKVNYGLRYNDELVFVMGFNIKNGVWEISRLASKLMTTISGGASKLFKHFIKNNDCQKIFTYCDRRFGTGKVYENLGFDLTSITKPDFYYTDKAKLFNRMMFQKHKLSEKLDNFDPELTGHQNMFNNGYRRIWGAGHFKYFMECK